MTLNARKSFNNTDVMHIKEAGTFAFNGEQINKSKGIFTRHDCECSLFIATNKLYEIQCNCFHRRVSVILSGGVYPT